MFETGATSWFYRSEPSTRREKEKRSQWLSEVLGRYQEEIVTGVRMGRVLPYLVYDGVFSLQDYKEIVSRGCYAHRVECFLLKLFSKGPRAFCAFCSHLEDFCPYLLTSLFLYYQERTHGILRDAAVLAEAKFRAQQEPGDAALSPEDPEQSCRLLNNADGWITGTLNCKGCRTVALCRGERRSRCGRRWSRSPTSQASN